MLKHIFMALGYGGICYLRQKKKKKAKITRGSINGFAYMKTKDFCPSKNTTRLTTVWQENVFRVARKADKNAVENWTKEMARKYMKNSQLHC